VGLAQALVEADSVDQQADDARDAPLHRGEAEGERLERALAGVVAAQALEHLVHRVRHLLHLVQPEAQRFERVELLAPGVCGRLDAAQREAEEARSVARLIARDASSDRGEHAFRGGAGERLVGARGHLQDHVCHEGPRLRAHERRRDPAALAIKRQSPRTAPRGHAMKSVAYLEKLKL
jgi:hypothetical protein